MELDRLPPRARTLFYLRAWMALLLFWGPALTIGSIVALGFVRWSVVAVVAGVAAFVLFLEAVWVPALDHARWGWAVRDHDLLVERGVFVKRRTAIPLSRIQHVDTRQGPLERMFGLMRLQVFTASGMGADASIPGLDGDIAERLRERLIARAHEEPDDGV